MPEFLVIHIGIYPADQLKEEHGCPTTQAVVRDAKNEAEAIKQSLPAFEGFGPVGRCLAVPYDPTERTLVPSEPVWKARVSKPEPEPPNPDVEGEGFVLRPHGE